MFVNVIKDILVLLVKPEFMTVPYKITVMDKDNVLLIMFAHVTKDGLVLLVKQEFMIALL